MKITANTSEFGEQLMQKLAPTLEPNRAIYKEVVIDLLSLVAIRIHHDGKASDGSQIGEYSDAYMRVRTGTFSNSEKISKGKNKGKNKNSGTATKGANKGNTRVNYNRTGDRKVILSLTRQLENDYAIIGITQGWAIGFHNSHNADKARWNNHRYSGKVIYELTNNELKYAIEKAKEVIKKTIENT